MSSLHVKSSHGQWVLAVSPGLSVLEVVQKAGIRLRSACGNVGACGLCRIRVEAGRVSGPTSAELSRLSADELGTGIRLACQVKPCEDVQISIEARAPAARWKSLPGADKIAAAAAQARPRLGIAVDLGTTQIRVALWDMNRGVRLAGRCGPNPQNEFGADVLTRLTLAAGSHKSAQEMAWLARGAIGDALSDLSICTGLSLRDVQQVVVVGNTAMLCLLTDHQQGLLLQPEFWTREIDCHPTNITCWNVAWGLDPRVIVEVIPPLAGFVGSDFLAAVIATQLTERTANTLLVDFGTNSEIGLWDGRTLWATSVPGGPAFEGSGIGCGMPAETGAIFRIEREDSSPRDPCQVIGGGEPLGVCGSGLVDAIANLVADGALGSSGRFTQRYDQGLPVARGRRNITLKPSDINVFLLAKAATSAGIACLLETAGLSPNNLQRVCVCGTFGSQLHVGRAQEVGLLPETPTERVELCENAALYGCEILLQSGERSVSLAALKKKAHVINLSQISEFEERFVEQLQFQPMRDRRR